ncbi:MAG: tetratricopeptide repeat protein [Isosphaeraceae bacterium]
MSPIEIAGQSRPKTSRPVRPVGPMIVAITAVVLACVLGRLWWQYDRSAPARRARAAAARGRSDLRAGRPDLALRAVGDIRDESPEAGEAMAVAGMALVRMGQYPVARMALERALKLQPDQFEAAVTLGELSLDLGNTRRGADVLTMAAQLRPREFGVWRLLGKALDDLNDPAGAAYAYQKALELRPADRDLLIALIGILINSGQSDLAEPWIHKALAKAPDNPVVLGFAARGAFDANRLDESLALADRSLRTDPRNPDALLARARCRVARLQWKDALPDAERAAAAAPNDLGTLHLLWIIETRLGLTDRAAATLEKRKRTQARAKLMDELTEELKLHPDDPRIPWRMGEVAIEACSFMFAGRCFEASLALAPDYQPAIESLTALRRSHPELARKSSVTVHPFEEIRPSQARSGPTQ